MNRIFYQQKAFLVKPIGNPEKLNIFKHIILFINEEDNSIERAIPDFKERYMDSASSNIRKMKKNTKKAFFELVDENTKLSTDEPIYSITIYDERSKSSNKTKASKVMDIECINGYSTSIESIIMDNMPEKIKKIG